LRGFGCFGYAPAWPADGISIEHGGTFTMIFDHYEEVPASMVEKLRENEAIRPKTPIALLAKAAVCNHRGLGISGVGSVPLAHPVGDWRSAA